MSDPVKVYPAYFKGDAINQIENMFLKIWAAKGLGRTTVINEVFETGLRAMLDKDGELRSKVDASSLAIRAKYKEKMARVMDQEQLEFVYETSALDEFVEFCTESGIDHEKFLATYKTTVATAKTKSEAMSRWLKDTLGNGEEYNTEDIKEAAEIDRVINDESDWNLMKSVASREGYSKGGKRGYWRKLQS
jgi:hypothetical protein